MTAAGKLRADTIAVSLPRRAWQRLSAGPGSKGPRYYDWAWISFHTADAECAGQRWLLIRRNNTTGELAFYRCYAPDRCHLPPWFASLVDAGPSRSRSRPARG